MSNLQAAYILLLLFVISSFASACGAAAVEPLTLQPEGPKGGRVLVWTQSSLKRVYPGSMPAGGGRIDLPAPRSGQVSFQVCLRNERTIPIIAAECTITGAEGLDVTVRRVGYVPMRHFTHDTPQTEVEGVGHIPGLVPDPLFPESKATVGPFETQAFWVTVRVPADAEPGRRDVAIRVAVPIKTGPVSADLNASLDISSLVLKPRQGFPVTHWWSADSLWDHYETGMFEDERWWEIARNYIKDMVDHGSDTVYVPIFFFRRETFVKPPQLLKVSEPEPGKYEFDWSDARRFVRTAKGCGARYYEFPHLWIYWGARNPMRVYKWVDGKAVMLWPPDSDGHGPVYYNFLRQYLPALHRFVQEEGILEKSFFHVSDEPGGTHLENYQKGRAFLKEVAPWMKVIDALGDIRYKDLTDMPVPGVNRAQAFIDAGVPHWVYFCCGPRGLWINRFMDTPLAKIRMSGWLFYRFGASGFLHWGYNYWKALEQERLIDPYTDSNADDYPNIPSGDPFVVYPGADGKPVDSIRWEVFAESLQDYQILQSAGIRRDDPMLSDIKSYAVFPKSEEWVQATIARILTTGK